MDKKVGFLYIYASIPKMIIIEKVFFSKFFNKQLFPDGDNISESISELLILNFKSRNTSILSTNSYWFVPKNNYKSLERIKDINGYLLNFENLNTSHYHNIKKLLSVLEYIKYGKNR